MAASAEILCKTIAKNIKCERTRKGWSQPVLADKLGESVRTLGRHESGEGITIDVVPLYAEALGCSVAELCVEKTEEEYRLYKAFERTQKLPDNQRECILGFVENGLKLYGV